MKKLFCLLMAFVLVLVSGSVCIFASGETAVSQVEQMLEKIDTLEQMQNKRSSYTAKSHYDITTTIESIITKHKAARQGYETYVADMFAKRKAAQQAYDSLTDAEKAQVNPALVSKLNNELPTVFLTGDYPVTPRDDEFCFEAVKIGTGFGYEVSNHMVSGSIPQTFVLVDTSDGKTTWTPDGEYVYGESDYDVVYCCDKETGVDYGIDYRRLNLEDSGYFGPEEAKKIRAVLENAYPYVTVDGMKESLKKGGMDEAFVDSLTRADMIAAVQMAVWSYANINDAAADGLSYFASIDVPKNRNIYFNPLHDYTNEIWDWLPGKRQRTYDPRAEYRVNTLAEFLCNSEPAQARKDQIIISEMELVKTELIDEENGLYHVTMYISLNGGGNEKDDLKIHARSYSENQDGTAVVTEETECQAVLRDGVYTFDVHSKDGDMVEITVDGRQMISKGAYFYDCGYREGSQSMVGISGGMTNVSVTKKTLFVADLANIPVQDIETKETEISVKEGETVQLAVTVKPENATNKELVFSSDNESVATVDEKGNIVAVGAGTAVITVYSADKPSVKKEITVTVKEVPKPIIPTIPNKHHICFGKTDGIGWYEVSINGGEFFPQGPNSTLAVEEGAIIVVRVQDMWINDEFDFYVNGNRIVADPDGTITLVVERYMLIGALSMDTEVPDVEESISLLQKIIRFFRNIFNIIAGWFR